jgi:hypothetical protein
VAIFLDREPIGQFSVHIGSIRPGRHDLLRRGLLDAFRALDGCRSLPNATRRAGTKDQELSIPERRCLSEGTRHKFERALAMANDSIVRDDEIIHANITNG